MVAMVILAVPDTFAIQRRFQISTRAGQVWGRAQKEECGFAAKAVYSYAYCISKMIVVSGSDMPLSSPSHEVPLKGSTAMHIKRSSLQS